MPRSARKISNSKIYHIMTRGNEKGNIFWDCEDKNRYLKTLEFQKEKRGFEIYAYCLMSNHVHLILKELNDQDVSRIMQGINVSYSYYFNKKYERVGHLFQGRFRSEPIESKSYCLEATRYIHNNPIKASICKKVSNYNWSSYKDYMKLDDKLVDINFILDIYSLKPRVATKMLDNFTRKINDDKFIEYEENEEVSVLLKGSQEIKKYINNYLIQNQILIENINSNKEIRNKLIRNIKKNSNISVRDLAVLLNISKSVIQRIATSGTGDGSSSH